MSDELAYNGYMMKENDMGWAKVQFERKQINRVLVRCKNVKHEPKPKTVEGRDRRKLERVYEFA